MESEAVNDIAQRFSVEELTEAIRIKFEALTKGELVPVVESNSVQTDQLDPPIEMLDLSQRTFNCLRRSRLYRRSDIQRCSAEELLCIRGFGKRSLLEIVLLMQSHGLSLSASSRMRKIHELQELCVAAATPGQLEGLDVWRFGYDHRSKQFYARPYAKIYYEALLFLERIGIQWPVDFLREKGFSQ